MCAYGSPLKKGERGRTASSLSLWERVGVRVIHVDGRVRARPWTLWRCFSPSHRLRGSRIGNVDTPDLRRGMTSENTTQTKPSCPDLIRASTWMAGSGPGHDAIIFMPQPFTPASRFHRRNPRRADQSGPGP